MINKLFSTHYQKVDLITGASNKADVRRTIDS